MTSFREAIKGNRRNRQADRSEMIYHGRRLHRARVFILLSATQKSSSDRELKERKLGGSWHRGEMTNHRDN